MKFVNIIKAIFAPSANDQLARLDAHLLADFGVITTYGRTDTVLVPSDLGVRLV